jgi:hypothetical protein
MTAPEEAISPIEKEETSGALEPPPRFSEF